MTDEVYIRDGSERGGPPVPHLDDFSPLDAGAPTHFPIGHNSQTEVGPITLGAFGTDNAFADALAQATSKTPDDLHKRAQELSTDRLTPTELQALKAWVEKCGVVDLEFHPRNWKDDEFDRQRRPPPIPLPTEEDWQRYCREQEKANREPGRRQSAEEHEFSVELARSFKALRDSGVRWSDAVEQTALAYNLSEGKVVQHWSNNKLHIQVMDALDSQTEAPE